MTFEIVKLGTDKYTEVLADANKSYNCSPNFAVRTKATREILADIHFQDGPVKEKGINGVANEDLIVMVMHRLNQFQESDYACKENADAEKSYVASLFAKGINKIAQKVGEEGVEVVIEAKDNNNDLFLSESADLLFHYLILLQAKGFELNDVVEVLKNREK